jgi:hypothetical protein
MVIPFQCLFCAPLDGCCPPEIFLNEMSRRVQSAHSRVQRMGRTLRSRPFWASLLSCVGLCLVTMGPSHLRLLAVFDEQLIMGASLQLVRLRMTVGPLSFPLHGLMTSRYRGESAVCLSSGRRGISPLIRSLVVKLLCHASPVFLRFRVNGSRVFIQAHFSFGFLKTLLHRPASAQSASTISCNGVPTWAKTST